MRVIIKHQQAPWSLIPGHKSILVSNSDPPLLSLQDGTNTWITSRAPEASSCFPRCTWRPAVALCRQRGPRWSCRPATSAKAATARPIRRSLCRNSAVGGPNFSFFFDIPGGFRGAQSRRVSRMASSFNELLHSESLANSTCSCEDVENKQQANGQFVQPSGWASHTGCVKPTQTERAEITAAR